jgi:2-polyprenyl-3-methyl-5-hydroxy-6-metoxy-1,4-benzoquinol methylase
MLLTDTAHLCRLCGSTRASVRLDNAVDYITGEQFNVQRCDGCGLATTDPQPASMDPYYPAAYRRYGGITLRMLRWLYGWRVRGWAKRFSRQGRALEVGCGEGWMLGALQRRGWQVLGSERTVEAAKSAAATNGIPMFVGDLDAIGSSARFDLIVLFQALEHLAEPVARLRQSADLLDPGGVLVVAVPNFASWQARAFGRWWFHLDVPRHLHHFSPLVLEAAFEKVGLRVIRTRFVSFEHDPYGWVQSVLNRMGFKQNLLTKLLMGMRGDDAKFTTVAPMILLTVLLVVPSVVLSLASWATGSGAIIEMWAAKA